MRPEFVRRSIEIVSQAEGVIDFVKLVCPTEELKRRIVAPSMLRFQKLADSSLFESLDADGVFDDSEMPEPRITIDTGHSNPAETARKIADTLQLAKLHENNRPTGNDVAERNG